MTMMTNGPTVRAIRRLHSGALAHGIETTDGQLLESFVSRTDEAAFEALVLRHGPMVLGVCRRILGDSHDAEDAFQAVFLVLVRKAASIVPRDLVANWLYGVAFRTANKARVMNATRRAREMHVRERPAPQDAHHELFWRELLPLLDSELQTLPDKYRAPIVLCDLEGKQRKDAARLLGWPEGTLSSRLAAGRKMLARRLGRRGVSLSLAAPMLFAQVAEPVPPALVATTVQAGILAAAGHATIAVGVSATVAALADGVVKAMLLAKLKVAVAVLLALALGGAGLGFFVGRGAPELREEKAASASTQSVVPPAPAFGADAAPEAKADQPPVEKQSTVRVIRVWTLQGDEFGTPGRSGARPTTSTPSAHPLPGIAIRVALTGTSEAHCIVDVDDAALLSHGARVRGYSFVPPASGAAPAAEKKGVVAWKIIRVQGQGGNGGSDGGFITVGQGTIWIAVPVKGTIVRPKGNIG
jgi:RNA polymerase sigma factor (sigma-70 family)